MCLTAKRVKVNNHWTKKEVPSPYQHNLGLSNISDSNSLLLGITTKSWSKLVCYSQQYYGAVRA